MKKLILILISIVCLNSCAHTVRLDEGDYMIVENATHMTKNIHRYKIATKMNNGAYKLGHNIIYAPANTYTVGDTLYFTINKPWE